MLLMKVLLTAVKLCFHVKPTPYLQHCWEHAVLDSWPEVHLHRNVTTHHSNRYHKSCDWAACSLLNVRFFTDTFPGTNRPTWGAIKEVCTCMYVCMYVHLYDCFSITKKAEWLESPQRSIYYVSTYIIVKDSSGSLHKTINVPKERLIRVTELKSAFSPLETTIIFYLFRNSSSIVC